MLQMHINLRIAPKYVSFKNTHMTAKNEDEDNWSAINIFWNVGEL